MSNITIKRENGGEWDPYRLTRQLLRWDPFAEMLPYRSSENFVAFVPSFEIKESKDGFMFKADVPGVKEQDIDITRTGNRLTISGKREAEKEDKADTYYAYERTYGSFTRSFTLPDKVDAEQIHADLKEGVLTLVVPKKPEAQPKKISLKNLFGKES